MAVIDIILKVFGALTGTIGTVLGVYNYVHARRKEARELEEKSKSQQEQDEEWKLYVSLMEKGIGEVFEPKLGSVEHKRAERLVEKGRLERRGVGQYQTHRRFKAF